MSKIRTFIGINASSRVNNNVARVISRLAETNPGYRWVDLETLHLTLNFVGDVLDTEVPELCKLVKNSIQSLPPFELSLKGVSGFPDATQPRVVWMGVDQGAEAMTAAYKQLEGPLHEWGVNKDRKAFVPHMTIGRLSRTGRWNQPMLDLMHRLRNHDGGFCTVSEVIVYSSFLDRSGPTYTPMSRVKLRG